jgi:hypothetical protein
MQRVNGQVTQYAAKSTEFVSSMFPANMHQRLFESSAEQFNSDIVFNCQIGADNEVMIKPQRISSNTQEVGTYKTKPIADLYPETTVMVSVPKIMLPYTLFIHILSSYLPVVHLSPNFRIILASRFSRFHGLEFSEGTNSGSHFTGIYFPGI